MCGIVVELCSYTACILQSMQDTRFNLEVKRERNFVSVSDCKNALLKVMLVVIWMHSCTGESTFREDKCG